MNAPANGQYTITQVTQSSAYSPQKGAYPTKQVHYRLKDGTTGHVEMHHDDYNADNVASVMDRVASEHESVMALNQSTIPLRNVTPDNPFS